MVLAVAKALEAGARSIVCASTGNTSASAAAYGAAAGLEVVVVLPAGKIAAGKLLQAQAAGAQGRRRRRQLRRRAGGRPRRWPSRTTHPITLVNSVNPFRLEGQKTAAFEVCDDLGGPPDVLAIPVGNAGNISAYWVGFRAYREAGVIDRLPADVGLPGGRRGADRGWATRSSTRRRSRRRSGSATPPRGRRRSPPATSSGGLIEAVTDEEIFAAYRDVSGSPGIFCEPASAASLAGSGSCAPTGGSIPTRRSSAS